MEKFQKEFEIWRKADETETYQKEKTAGKRWWEKVSFEKYFERKAFS